MRLILFFIFFVLCYGLESQSNIAIGEWASYLPHQQTSNVTQSAEKIIYATNEAIFTIDKEDFSINYLSKVEGLTETGISEITYDNFNDQLIIAYDNSTIDLVAGSQVTPVFDLKNNTNFLNRRINKMFVQNEKWLYLSTGFGLIQYNLQNNDFGFTLDAGQLVTDVTGDQNYLAILGANGVFVLDFINEFFPNAFTSWDKVESGLPGDYNARAILIRNNKMYIADSDSVYVSYDFKNFEAIYGIDDAGYLPLFLQELENGWFLGLKDNAKSRAKLLFFDDMDIPINEISGCTNRMLDAVVDEDGRVFFADEWDQVRFIDETGACHKESFQGPFNVEAADIAIKEDKVYVASGGISDNFSDREGRQGVYILENGSWNNINQDNNAFFKTNNIIQFYQIEAHPNENKFYIGSFWSGLIEYNEETQEQTLYTAANTQGALGPAIGDEQRTRMSGLTFDDDNNLWMASFNAAKPLVVLTDEGTWHSFEINADGKLTDLVVDDLGYVWGVIAGNAGGVIVYDPGESIQDPTDGRPVKLLNINNSEIPSNIVNSIAKDLDGTIWIGTAEGVVAFECGGSVFDGTCTGNKRKVEVDGIAAFLLETEDVQAIAVDGANRKWFGTKNGIFVQSSSGEEQIAKYDVDNSPLFDNNIKAMAYNGKSGEMFIASNKGIQSFRTPTTEARPVHSSNVFAFPNPVRPEYRGEIAIKGLARDANVKITDVDGQLVFQTEALGGQAIWNGKDISGREVSGGVYLVFSSSTDAFFNPDSYVTKILMIR